VVKLPKVKNHWSRLSWTKKSNKNLILTIYYCTSFHVKLAFFAVFVQTLQTGFAARWCFWFSANDSSIAQVCPPLIFMLCVKKHQWKRSIVTNKVHFLQPMLPLQCANAKYHHNICAVKSHPAHLQLSKTLKKHEKRKAIWTKYIFCLYFMKICIYSSFLFKENIKYPVWICRDPISLILGTRFSILGTRIGSLKHLKKPAYCNNSQVCN